MPMCIKCGDRDRDCKCPERAASDKKNMKQLRLMMANKLLSVISSCGRRFFYHKGKVSMLDIDHRGRVWFIDAYTGKKIYTHYRYQWRGFSEGGTLKDLICVLRDFIVRGKRLHVSALGPWPDWVCNGDLWGYGDDMEKVRTAARDLGIIESSKQGEVDARQEEK